MRVAVVDLGTNSTRLLVADVRGGAVEELARRTEVTRLGEGVDAGGRLSEEAIERVLEVLGSYRDEIERRGAERVACVATSAVRDARNGDAFRARVAERIGTEARTISGEEEARLTFRGATTRRSPARGATMVVDIGGGSTEYVVGPAGGEPDFHVSTDLGSVRHTERHLHRDPPGHEEMTSLAADVRDTIRAQVPERLRAGAAEGIAVAGTATSLAAIDQELEPYDPERVHGYRLPLAACERILAMLATLPLEERREVTGLHPDRAPTIVAGAAILAESVRAFGLDEVEVSEADILHGAALAAAEGGGEPGEGRTD